MSEVPGDQNTRDIDPQEIIGRIRDRDQRGLTALYHQYSAALYGIILRTIQDEGHAEDILQQTFVKIWNAIELYDETRGSLYTWISTIARNLALDLRRLKSFEVRSKTDALDSVVYSSNVISRAVDGSSIDVARLLSGMDEKYRIVLQLMYLQGYTQSEVAEHLDIPLGTVKTRARKAIDSLRDLLQNEKRLFTDELGLLILAMSQAGLIEIFRK